MPPDFEDPLAEKLFDAARRERPHARVRTRVAVALDGRRRSFSGSRLAWLAGMAAVVAGTVVGLLVRRAPLPGISAEVVSAEVDRGSNVAPRGEALNPPRGSAERPSAAATIAVSAAPARSVHSTAPAKARKATQVEEFQLVDRARELLASGATASALAALDLYDRTPSDRSLGSEAALLRIEALAQSGRSSEAATLAERFLAQHPNSPLTDRVRSFAARPAPPADSRSPGIEP